MLLVTGKHAVHGCAMHLAMYERTREWDSGMQKEFRLVDAKFDGYEHGGLHSCKRPAQGQTFEEPGI